MEEKERAGARLLLIRHILDNHFARVEGPRSNTFLVWGANRFRHRPYVELAFGEDFLADLETDFESLLEQAIQDAEQLVRTPNERYKLQGEIVISNEAGVRVHRRY